MAEPKKVALQTLAPMKKDKKKESKSRTVRFTLTLTESNEKSCPEFNYGELVSEHLRKLMGRKSLGDVINTPMLDPTDPFAGNEDEALKVLAKQFERKYGTGTHSGKKKKRNRSLDDFNVLGEGYDETDPFIDNSDAYDGVVPTHIETKHGGFYINSGELNFCEVDTSQDSVQSEVEAPRKRKANCLDSESDSDHANNNEDGEEVAGSDEDSKKNMVENGNLKNKCRKLDEGELLRRRKMMISKMNAKKLEKKEKEEKAVNGSDKGSEGGEGTGTKAIAASIEAVVSKARQETTKVDEDEQEEEDNDSGSSSSSSGSSDSDSSDSSSSSENDSDGEEENNNKSNAGAENGLDQDQQGMSGEDEDHKPLPENLPDDLLQVLNQIKEVGRASKGSSQKFFTDSVNKMLLSIEMKLNRIGSRKKTKIYNHLANHLPCGTQTLVKRAKNLLSEWQETRLREPLKRLKEVVDKAMPSLIEEHALECQKMAESKGEEGSDEVNNKEEDGNEEGGGGGGTTKKKARLPKKKFIFTEEIRQYLCNVVKVRVKFWQMVKKRSETADEHILGFLDSEVKPLWPKGWVTGRILYKESYQAHGVITDKNFKPSVNRKVGGGSSGGSGGSGSANNSPSRPSQPPRPSLTATALPKSSPGSNKSSPGPSSPVGTAGRSSASVVKVPGGPSTPNTTSGTTVKTSTPPPLTPPSAVTPSAVEAITTGTTTVKAVAASTVESPVVSDNNVKKVVIEKKSDGERKDRSETSAQSKGGNTVEGSKTVNSKIGSPSDTVRLGLGKEDKNVDSSKIASGKSSGLTSSGLSLEKGGASESRSVSVDGAKSGVVSQKDSGSVGVPKSGGSLTIKTVDKINENAMQKQCSPAVSIIDLSSDEEKSTENMLAKSGDKTRVTDTKSKGTDVRTCSSAGEVKESGSSAKSKSVYSSSKKDDDLDEKLDSVLNEILQISRQMSGENSNKLNEAKESGSPAPRHAVSSKPQPQPQQQQQLQQTKVRKSSGMQQQQQPPPPPPPPSRNVPQQSKGSSVLVSGPWNKQEVSLTTVHSNNAPGATSWAGKEISPSRQRNTAEVYNMASKTSGTSSASSSSSSRLPNLGAGISIVRPSGTSSHGYNSVSKQTTQAATAKQRSESFTSSQSTTSSNHSLYNSLTPEQHMNLLKQQQQQQQPQQQSHKQQHLLSQMNSASTPFLSSMANVNSDVLSFMDTSMNSLDVFNNTQKGSNKHKSQYW